MTSFRRAWKGLADAAYFRLHGGVKAARRKGVRVGRDCRIYIRDFGTEPFLVSTADRTTIMGGVRILTHDGSTGLVSNERGRRYQRFAPVTIGSDVFVGVGAILLPGVTIQSRCIVGAGSVVVGDVPEGTVVAGNPARPIGTFEAFRQKVKATCPNDEDLDGAGSYPERVVLALRLAESVAAGPSRQGLRDDSRS